MQAASLPSGSQFTPASSRPPDLIYSRSSTVPQFSPPNGQQLAFLVNKKGTSFTPGGGLLYLLRLSTGEAAPVPGAQGALFPFWSPDGKYLGFFSEGKLKKVPVAGGTVQV